MIRFENVTSTYPGHTKPALVDVSADIDKGEFVFLVGESGSGKSTFLRLVLRETQPTSGRVFVADKEVNRLPKWKVPALRRQIGTVFQDFRLLPDKTVSENVAFALRVIGKPRSLIQKVVPETLELVGLEGKGHRLPDELSGGEQQRVAIARAFVNRPMILIADEPTGNLDADSARAIVDLFVSFHQVGVTIVLSTHDEASLGRMGGRRIALAGGVLAAP